LGQPLSEKASNARLASSSEVEWGDQGDIRGDANGNHSNNQWES